MNKLVNISVLAITALCSFCLAAVDTETTSADGYGQSYLEAVDNAMISAVQQVRGAEVTIARKPLKLFKSQSDANILLGSGTSSQSTVMIDTTQSIYLKRFKGYLKSYKVVNSQQLSEENWQVTIEAEVYKYKDPEKGAVKRDTIAILPLHAEKSEYSFFDKTISANKITDAIAAELNVQIVNSDKLDVLDRSYLSDIANELHTVTADPKNLKQQVLLGMVSGADYIATGTVRDFRVGNISRGSSTLGFVSHKYQAKITIDLKIIAVGSSKIISAEVLDLWLDHDDIISQRRDTNDFGKLDTTDQLLIISRKLAEKISDITIEKLYPAKVAKIIGDQVIISAGDANVNVGDQYYVEAGAEKVLDPDTGEVLGEVGGETVMLEVTQVREKISMAKVVQGKIEVLRAGNVCIRYNQMPPEKNTKGGKGGIQPNANGVIRLPGD